MTFQASAIKIPAVPLSTPPLAAERSDRAPCCASAAKPDRTGRFQPGTSLVFTSIVPQESSRDGRQLGGCAAIILASQDS